METFGVGINLLLLVLQNRRMASAMQIFKGKRVGNLINSCCTIEKTFFLVTLKTSSLAYEFLMQIY